jgi:hypothetical protein
MSNCQLYWRLFHPVITSGSTPVAPWVLPKLGFAIAPHSPFAARLSRSQSGTKFRLASFHDRVVLTTRRSTGDSEPVKSRDPSLR